MRKAVVLATMLVLATAASAAARPTLPVDGLLRIATALTGIKAPASRVTLEVVPARTLRARAERSIDARYPRDRQTYDQRLYRALGVLGPTEPLRPALLRALTGRMRVVVEPSRRIVSVTAGPASRSLAVEGLVRLLEDGAYGLSKRIAASRESSDATLAAVAAADGAAEVTVRTLRSAAPAPAQPRTRADAFLSLQAEFPSAVGTRLAANLYNVGGTAALRGLMQRPPDSSEQVFHVDKYLARERPTAILLPTSAGGFSLARTDSFGELDVRALLAVFSVPRLDRVGSGWGGGLSALYRDATGREAIALRLDWDSERDAQEWQEAVGVYVNEAFDAEVPGQPQTTPCAADLCWSLPDRSIAFVRTVTATVLVLAPALPAAAAVARELVPAS